MAFLHVSENKTVSTYVLCFCCEVDLHEQSRVHIARNLAVIPSLVLCSAHGKHKSGKRAKRRDYNLFAAIDVACLPCIRRALETDRELSPDVASDTHKWNIRDYADDAVIKNIVGVADVLAYLQTYWSHIARNRQTT